MAALRVNTVCFLIELLLYYAKIEVILVSCFLVPKQLLCIGKLLAYSHTEERALSIKL